MLPVKSCCPDYGGSLNHLDEDAAAQLEQRRQGYEDGSGKAYLRKM
jgi:hypothetical protein